MTSVQGMRSQKVFGQSPNKSNFPDHNIQKGEEGSNWVWSPSVNLMSLLSSSDLHRVSNLMGWASVDLICIPLSDQRAAGWSTRCIIWDSKNLSFLCICIVRHVSIIGAKNSKNLAWSAMWALCSRTWLSTCMPSSYKFVPVRTPSSFVSIFWFEIQTTSYCNSLALYMLHYKEAAVSVA